MSDTKKQIKELQERVKALKLEGQQKDSQILQLKFAEAEKYVSLEQCIEILVNFTNVLESEETAKRLRDITVAKQVEKTAEGQSQAFSIAETEISTVYNEEFEKMGIDGEIGITALQTLQMRLRAVTPEKRTEIMTQLQKMAAAEESVVMRAVIGDEKYNEIVKVQNEVVSKLQSLKTDEERTKYVNEVRTAGMAVEKKIQEQNKKDPSSVQDFINSLPDDERTAILRTRILYDLSTSKAQQQQHAHSHSGPNQHSHSHSGPNQHSHSHSG